MPSKVRPSSLQQKYHKYKIIIAANKYIFNNTYVILNNYVSAM